MMVRRQSAGVNAFSALDRVHALDLDHGQHLLVNYQDLCDLTSWVLTLKRHLVTGKASVAALDQATGRSLHMR